MEQAKAHTQTSDVFCSAAGAGSRWSGAVRAGDHQSCRSGRQRHARQLHRGALDAALAVGGAISFDCGPAAHTITVTSVKTITADTAIDGGGLISLSGGMHTGILRVESNGVTLELADLTLRDTDNPYASLGQALYNAGTVPSPTQASSTTTRGRSSIRAAASPSRQAALRPTRTPAVVVPSATSAAASSRGRHRVHRQLRLEISQSAGAIYNGGRRRCQSDHGTHHRQHLRSQRGRHRRCDRQFRGNGSPAACSTAIRAIEGGAIYSARTACSP